MKDKRKIHFFYDGRVVCGQEGGRQPITNVPVSRAGWPLRSSRLFREVTCKSCRRVVEGTE